MVGVPGYEVMTPLLDMRLSPLIPGSSTTTSDFKVCKLKGFQEYVLLLLCQPRMAVFPCRIFTSERSSRKSMARPDKVCGTGEEDGKMRPGKLY